MVGMVKLVRNGNSTQLTVPRTMLINLGWLPGDHIVLAVNEDKTITARRITREELGIKREQPRIFAEPTELAK